MKPSCFSWAESARWVARILSGLALASLLTPQPSRASGVVTNCTDADLRAALAGGGLVTFECDGTIVLTNTLTIANSASLDASGRTVSLSGSNAVRLFLIQPGATLALRHLTLADGTAAGTNGAANQPGGPGEGGAVRNDGGILFATDCVFLRNKAVGGMGGGAFMFFTFVGEGGTGAGGAIFSLDGGNFLTNVVFSGNRAIGGNGGTGGPITSERPSGAAYGGAVYLSGGTLAIQSGSFVDNGAAFGIPGRADRYDVTAGVAGGALYSLGGSVQIVGSSLVSNACGLGVGPATPVLSGNARGGAIYHQGDRLALTDTLFLSNRASGGPNYARLGISMGVGDALGGGIFINGTGAITNCTLAGNLAQGGPWQAGIGSGGPAGSGLGGAICNQSALVLLNCTLAGNAARAADTAPEYGSGLGGGLCNIGGAVTLNHVTAAGNLTSGTTNLPGYKNFSLGGGLFSTNGTVRVLNSMIVNSPSGSNGFGTFVDGGHNISSDASFHFSAPGSLNNTDPVLGPLTNYGGPTPTMALLAGSPALDAADSANCPATDQRGIARPFGAGCDIGAFESAPPYTILGHVHGFTTPASGIQLTSPTGSASVPPSGQFAVHGLATGTHLLSVSSPECVFVPRTLSLTVGPDIVDAGFFSYRTNALFIERLSPGHVRWAYAGEAGANYHVLSGTNVTALTPTSTNQAQANGLIEFTEGTGVSMRFLQVVRP